MSLGQHLPALQQLHLVLVRNNNDPIPDAVLLSLLRPTPGGQLTRPVVHGSAVHAPSDTVWLESFRYNEVHLSPIELCITSGTLTAKQGEELRQLSSAIGAPDPDPVDWRSFRLVCLT